MTVRASTNTNAELIRLHVEPFDCISDVALQACRLAYANDQRVGFTFNGVSCQAGPVDQPQDVVDRYHRDYDLAVKERRRGFRDSDQ